MDFRNVTAVTIPEGAVASIWEAVGLLTADGFILKDSIGLTLKPKEAGGLLTADGFILKDSTGLTLKTKEE